MRRSLLWARLARPGRPPVLGRKVGQFLKGAPWLLTNPLVSFSLPSDCSRRARGPEGRTVGISGYLASGTPGDLGKRPLPSVTSKLHHAEWRAR